MNALLPFLSWRYFRTPFPHPILRAVRFLAFWIIALTVAASCLVLSGFNGIHQKVMESYGVLQPDFKIISSKGNFSISVLEKLQSQIPEVFFTPILEAENMVSYKEKQALVGVLGIEDHFLKKIKEKIRFEGESNDFFVYLSLSLWQNLAYKNDIPLDFWHLAGDIETKKDLKNALREYPLWSNGFFADLSDQNILLLELSLAQKLLHSPQNEISAIGIFTDYPLEIEKKIKPFLTENQILQDRAAQNLFFSQISRSEKNISFGFLLAILILAITMLILLQNLVFIAQKKERLIFYHLGMSSFAIEKIFVFLGIYLVFFANLCGLMLGIFLITVQHFFPFLWIDEHQAFPFVIYFSDLFWIFCSTLLVGFLCVGLPVYYKKYGISKSINA